MATTGWTWRLALLALIATGDARREVSADEVRFNDDVLPILAENCLACHGFDKRARQAGLRLDRFEGATAELESGARAVVPGKPDESELIRRIFAADADVQMPPPESGKRLTADQQAILRRWIAAGASYERHWSFNRPQAIAPPTVAGVVHPIDQFIQSRLRQDSLSPSPAADDRTLIRRICLDLIGLPPTPSEVDAFVVDAAKDREAAYRELVERLLDSPHYGERWGRWWLDQARYADSDGYSSDDPRVIWAYRDWVVSALNGDMPFNQFTIEQIAGDLLPNATQNQKIATGFHRNTQINGEGGIDPEQYRMDSIFDRVATTGTVWLGLTLGCAQCHDHKFDPIEQVEYYRLFSILNNQDEPTLSVYVPEVDVAALEAERAKLLVEINALVGERTQLLGAWEQGLSDAQKGALPESARNILEGPRDQRGPEATRELYAVELGKEDDSFVALSQRLAEVQRQLDAPLTTTLVMQERTEPRKTHLLIKGDFTRPAEEVGPGVPSVLHPLVNITGKSNRLDLAYWLVSPENPLTARVIANRVWQVYFGRGIVETDNDLGVQGSPPSHSELLDWLAVEFQQRGWSLKHLHRLIVTSHTYRQSSADRPDLLVVDPHNYLLARQRRLRLDAELVRDVALRASGLLSAKLGGPPVFPPVPEGAMQGGQVVHEWKTSSGEDRYRRGLYTNVYRATPPPALNVFDAPDGYSVCTRRLRSNTPLQALTLLNDGSYVELAMALEKRIGEEGLEGAFCRCTSRRPSVEELAVLQSLDAFSAARVLLNLDETVTRE